MIEGVWKTGALAPTLLASILAAVLGALLASTHVFAGQVRLQWNPTTLNEDNPPTQVTDLAGYRILYGTTNGGPYPTTGANIGNVTSHTLTGLACGTRLYFVVKARDTSGNISNGNSNQLAVTPDCDNDNFYIEAFSSQVPPKPADCDDNNALRYPGAPEINDHLDNDCDGQIDENNRAPVISSVVPTPSSGVAPLSVALACNATDADNDPLTYNWVFGDGQTQNNGGRTPSHSYATPGTYTATCTAVDGFGGQASLASSSIVVSANSAPIISSVTATPASGTAPLTTSLVCTASDSNGDTLTYNWTFGDGQSQNSAPSSVPHTYSASGTFSANCNVSDGRGGSANRSVNVVVSPGNSPPTVSSVTATPSSGIAPLNTALVCTASDPNGDPLTYNWTFGDGQSQNSAPSSVSHTYSSAGSFSATCTVSDGRGGTANRSVSVNVTANIAPVISSVTATPASGTAPLTTTLACNASDANGDSLTYNWTFGDGQSQNSAPSSVSHTYSSSGTFSATCTVSDGRGGSANRSVGVSVSTANGAPTISSVTATPSSGTAPLTTSLVCTASDPNSDPLTYNWTFGDGQSQNSAPSSVSHTYSSSGTFSATCTVNDGRGGTANRSVSISVSAANGAPTVSNVTATPSSGIAPLTTSLVCTASDPNGDILTYSWTFGDGQSQNSAPSSVSHTYSTAGAFSATCTVSDGRGGSANRSVSVSVSANGAPTITSFTANPTSGTAPLSVSFACRATDPNAGDTISYNVNFGDGTASGPDVDGNVSHSYAARATAYPAVCTATDNRGASTNSNAVNISVSAANGSPTISSLVADPAYGKAPLGIVLSVSASDPNGDNLVYDWNFGDTQTASNVSATSVSHTYNSRGAYNACVVARDNRGGTASQCVIVQVTGRVGVGAGRPRGSQTQGLEVNECPFSYRFHVIEIGENQVVSELSAEIAQQAILSVNGLQAQREINDVCLAADTRYDLSLEFDGNLHWVFEVDALGNLHVVGGDDASLFVIEDFSAAAADNVPSSTTIIESGSAFGCGSVSSPSTPVLLLMASILLGLVGLRNRRPT